MNFWQRKALGEFGKSLVVRQILTMSRAYIKKVNKQEFAKILLAKRFTKVFLRQKFVLYGIILVTYSTRL